MVKPALSTMLSQPRVLLVWERLVEFLSNLRPSEGRIRGFLGDFSSNLIKISKNYRKFYFITSLRTLSSSSVHGYFCSTEFCTENQRIWIFSGEKLGKNDASFSQSLMVF